MSESVLHAILRSDLKAFTEKVFATVDQSAVYLDNWHIQAICHQLTRCYEGEINNLMITQPPRSMKSICASVALVAWALGKDPALKIICVSYSGPLAIELARQCRMVMESEWYQALFSHTRLSKTTETELITTKGGGRFATSIGGTLTGRGADIIIIDDPLKADDAHSETKRREVIDWYRGTLSTRLNNKKTGRIILTMQRLHEEDLAGYLIEGGAFEHLDLPARAIEDQTVALGNGEFHYRKAGSILHPEREGDVELARAEANLGSLAYSAQYQQRPVPADGNLFRRVWLRSYDAIPSIGNPIVVQSWDTAMCIGEANDYSVCITAIMIGPKLYVVDVFRDRLAQPALRKKVIELAKEYGARVLLIEKAGSGFALLDEFATTPPPGVPRAIGIKPNSDKVSRAHAASVLVERGNLFLPEEAAWLAGVIKELMAFPNAKHDDQVDALTQLINWAEERNRRAAAIGGIGPQFIVPAGQIVTLRTGEGEWGTDW